ncbi:hypothetical protein C8R44DRAFT_742435 [Mycena epipterygia]|nr:hypothetical protein C8R44DRAFT_742435 [Mycena epipterygia]
MEQHPEGKKDSALCLCRSHDCASQTWQALDGTTKKGHWWHKSTVYKHGKKDRDFIEAGVMPPAPNISARNEIEAQPPMVAHKLPTALRIVSDEGDVSEDGTGLAARRRLVFLACALAAWLHIVCGVSRDASNRALKVLGLIIAMVAASGTNHKIPEDVRTAVKQLLLPPLQHSTLGGTTDSRRPQNCATAVVFHAGFPELASTLSIPAWDGGASSEVPPPSAESRQDDLHLGQPSMAKPRNMWHFEDNTYFAGITPPPKEPTVTTMTALLDPVVDQFQGMWEGKLVPTYNHPEGDFYRVAILAAIGDLLALKKALGFAGHASHNFCSYCKLQRGEIDRLDYENFEPRRGWEVLRAAREWLQAKTQVARKAIFAKHGNRHSPFNTITYRDPVKHTVLGPMHGWIEGILQHHCRLKWGIGSDVAKAGSTGVGAVDVAFSDVDSDVDMMDVDDGVIAAELEDLHQDSFVQNDAPASLIRRASSFYFIPESDDKIIEPCEEEDDDDDEADDEEAIYESEKPSRKMCRKGRLLASISDSARTADSKSPVAEAMRILSPRESVSMNSQRPQQFSPAEETAFNGSGPVLEASIYEMIFSYWNRTYSPPYIRAADLTYDLLDAGVSVFPNRAVQLTNFEHKTRGYSTFKKHAGTSSISFRHPSTGRKDMGFIRSICTQVLHGQSRIFVVVQPHTDLSPTDAAKTPYPARPLFACTVKYWKPLQPQAHLVVEPRHIISHVAYNPRLKGTYGIKHEIAVFVDSLHRNRD